ncbi:hypothetical protein XS74_17010 [Salmonella enterica subsp. enterica]|nr:hypothetical protein [Salmonella enterica subsp. salamae]ECF7067351.1 hypothetical protein [Salmonella enterica subsp. enterica]
MGLNTYFSSILIRLFFAVYWLLHRLVGTALIVKVRLPPQCHVLVMLFLAMDRYNSSCKYRQSTDE